MGTSRGEDLALAHRLADAADAKEEDVPFPEYWFSANIVCPICCPPASFNFWR